MKVIYKIDEIQKVAEIFIKTIFNKKDGNLAAQHFSPSFKNRATVVCLTGDLGAGKTTLMQTVGKILGIENNMISPTFVLRRDYEIIPIPSLTKKKTEYFKNLIHIDAYRLEKPEMIDQILTKEERENTGNLIIIEWGEFLDKNIFDLAFEIKHITETEREISLK